MAIAGVQEIADVITAIDKDRDRERLEDWAADYPEYLVAQRFFDEKRLKKDMDGGAEYEFFGITGKGNSAKFVPPYHKHTPSQVDVLTKGRVPIVRLADEVYYELGEFHANQSPARLQNTVKAKMDAMDLRIVELMEEQFAKLPNAVSGLEPLTLPYWLTKNETSGFNGGNPSGFSATGNIDRDSYPGFKNYTAQYSAITFADCVRRIREAIQETGWKTPMKINELSGSPNQELLVDKTTRLDLEDLLGQQNDNLGRNLAPFAFDGPAVGKYTVTTWHALSDEDAGTIYGMDWGSWFMACEPELFNRKFGPTGLEQAGQPTVIQVIKLYTFNFLCVNPKKNFVIQKAA